MVNLRARQYEPAMNRFSQKDLQKGSVTNPLSLNRYVYVLNSPIQYVDATGMSSTSAIAIPSAARASIEEAEEKKANPALPDAAITPAYYNYRLEVPSANRSHLYE